MNKGAKGKNLSVFVLFAVFLAVFPRFVAAESAARGNVVGFLYAKDGTTPLEGATVKFKNLISGAIIESSRSDSNGIFKVQGLEIGIYTYGVLTPDGDFNADSLVGFKIKENETAKMSIVITPYSKEEASAVSQVYKDQGVAGESLIGTVADFDPATQMAQIQVVKGLLQLDDKIHARGKTTNFYQQVRVLMAGDSSARKILAGQTASVKLERKADQGDLIYVVPKKTLSPLFLVPLGVASILAGSSGINYGIVKINDEIIPVSAHRNK